jgi:O-acetyl-ADP-ribose deacetylase (regulator of RNase III)
MQRYLDGRVLVKVGDLTVEEVDAIVNAANSTLLGGGGVDGAIHRAGGPGILEECRRIRHDRLPDGLPTGEAVMTTAGNMPARFVIHTVGPIYGENRAGDAELLAACYRNSLQLAVDNSLSTVAFPAISTGVYGYPRDEAAQVSSAAIAEFLSVERAIEQVRLIFHKPDDAEVFLRHHRFPG